MSEEERHELLDNSGTPVHRIDFWDKNKVLIIISLFLGLFLLIQTGNVFIGFVAFFGIYIVLYLIRLMFLAFGDPMNPYHTDMGIIFNCVHCGEKLVCGFPARRINCNHCKKDNGFFDGKVYKITKENEKCFDTEEQMIKKAVSKTNNDNNKSNKKDSNLDELKKLKELLDMDAITQEEYDKKKKELLK